MSDSIRKVDSIKDGMKTSPQYQSTITEEDFNEWLQKKVWLSKNNGSEQKIIPISSAAYLKIRRFRYMLYIFDKYKYDPRSKYFWIKYYWIISSLPRLIWDALRKSWYKLYPEDEEDDQ